MRAETRPPNVQGEGEVTIRDLVKNALRMRPDRIVVGECRGAEALDMLQAMNTGHEGSMTTIHANTTEDALRRLETMVRWADGAETMPTESIREQIVTAVDIIIQVTRYGDERKISAISEVQELRHGKILVKDIFRFDVLGTDPETNRLYGRFDATGVVPKNLPHMERRGIKNLGRFFHSSLVQEEIGEELSDDSVTEIMINGRKDAYVERRGAGMVAAPIEFPSDAHLLSMINSIIAPLGKRLDAQNPTVDARLPDGSRVNAVIPPVSQSGPALTIRRFPKHPLTIDDLIRSGSLSPEVADFLATCVQAKLNILISGGTGTGKTTLLNVLSSFIEDEVKSERLITIEDTAELQLQQEHWIRLESRQADDYGEGEVTIRDLVKNALRMRPDRIIVGECRGGEALDMLQAMNTGHEGSMTTVHANTPQDAFSRLETMTMMAGMELPSSAIRAQIVGALDIIVQITRSPSGKRRVHSVCEVIKDRSRLEANEIFGYRVDRSGPARQVSSLDGLRYQADVTDEPLRDETDNGRHYCLDPQPAILQKMRDHGVTVGRDVFQPLYEAHLDARRADG